MSTKKKRCYDNLHTFICRLLKNYEPKASMTAECKDIINHLMRDLSLRYITCSVALCRHATKVTIDSNAIVTLTKIWIDKPEPLLEFAYDTWDYYSQNTTKGIKKHLKAGLILPPARFKEMFKEHQGINQQIGEPAYIFLTAIIEAVFGLIITQAINIAKIENRTTITGLYLFHAINSEPVAYLRPLFNNNFIAGFGRIGNVLLFDAQKRYLQRKSSYHYTTESDSE